MNTFTQQVEHIKDRYDTSMWLGRIIWYSLTEDAAIDYESFVQLAETTLADVEHTPLPSPPRSFDVFIRACTKAQSKRTPLTDSSYANYLVRHVASEAGDVWRNIVREVVDSEGHRLSYAEVVQLHFERSTSKIHVDILDQDIYNSDLNIVDVLDQIHDYYDSENNKLTTYTIREFIRKNLEWRLHSIKVRPSGGIYFVHETNGPGVDAFEALVAGLPGSNTLHQLPLLDDGKQREMVREAFETEAIEEVDTLIAELREVVSSERKVSANKFADYHEKFSTLTEKIAGYSDLLDMTLTKTSFRLESLQELLTSTLSQVRSS